jgi:MFS family permease
LNAPKPQPGIYYGWYIVGACFVILGVEAGAGASFPVFFKPLIEEFGWSRTALSGTVSIGLVAGGLAIPLWGTWTDRSGPRLVVVTAALFAGLSLLLRGQITSLWPHWGRSSSAGSGSSRSAPSSPSGSGASAASRWA